jgi:hypothetical protein
MSLTGVWMNELRSIMVVEDPGDGTLRGRYRSIVGRDPHIRELSGRTSKSEEGKQLLGFAVCFQIETPGLGSGHYSLCTWSGWARDDDRIQTHWLLTLSKLSPQDEWSSTLIGEDSFEKVLDTPKEEHLSADVGALRTLLTEARSRR